MYPILADLSQFGLSWGKFFAQVIIFVIVYMVLKNKAFGPIQAMLEQRRQRIADGEAKLDKIAKDLAEAEKNAQAKLDEASRQADRLVKDAGESAKALAERKQQDAILEAGQIMAKAREAAHHVLPEVAGAQVGEAAPGQPGQEGQEAHRVAKEHDHDVRELARRGLHPRSHGREEQGRSHHVEAGAS